MNRKYFVAVCVTLAIAMLTVGAAMAEFNQPDSTSATGIPRASLAPWTFQPVDVPNSVGSHVSLAFNPFSGGPFMSYYDETNGDLRLANAVPGGTGNCGEDGNGYCRAIDGDAAHGDTNVGTYSSIDVWGTEAHWQIGISYYSISNKGLKFALWDSNNPSDWEITTIQPGLVFQSYGLYTSFKFGSDGSMHIAYYTTSIGDEALMYAHPVTNGGNCGAGKWQCDTIDSGEGVGGYSSLDLNANNQPRISYYDGLNKRLKFAYYLGNGVSGVNCGNNAWRCITVDLENNSGMFTSLVVTQNPEKWHIAYYNTTTGKLKYAYYLGQSGNGNCGFSSVSLHFEWQCDVIDTVGDGLPQVGIGMAMDTAGYPFIAYMDAAEDLAPSMLNIARPALATQTFAIGNCGPVPDGYLFQTWQCDVLDNAAYGSGNVDLAQYLSIAINPAGLAFIAYYENDSYNDPNLKLAYQQFELFLPVITR